MDMSILSDPGVQKTVGNIASSVLGKPNVTSSSAAGYYDGGNYTVNFGSGSKGTTFSTDQKQQQPNLLGGGMDATSVALMALAVAAVLLVMKKKG